MAVEFTIDHEAFEAVRLAITAGGDDAREAAIRVMRMGAQEFRRNVARVSPVEFGHMRQSWQVHEQIEGTKVIIDMGTSIKSDDGAPYPLYLELGTDRIAGGAVKEWEPGQPPIMEWPAKMKDIPNFFREESVGKEGSKKFERAVRIATAAFTLGHGEQMPMIRPVAWEMMPRIAKEMEAAAQMGFKQWFAGKKFGKG